MVFNRSSVRFEIFSDTCSERCHDYMSSYGWAGKRKRTLLGDDTCNARNVSRMRFTSSFDESFLTGPSYTDAVPSWDDLRGGAEGNERFKREYDSAKKNSAGSSENFENCKKCRETTPEQFPLILTMQSTSSGHEEIYSDISADTETGSEYSTEKEETMKYEEITDLPQPIELLPSLLLKHFVTNLLIQKQAIAIPNVGALIPIHNYLQML